MASFHVGLIQLGQEQVLIQPLNSSQGQEHLVSRKWSLTPSPSPETQMPGQLCKVLTGMTLLYVLAIPDDRDLPGKGCGI
ncbi:hypothetical protein Celaphus_00015152 [Cervus elaphus hippelaphus]|uniref:Uncharacterized protein n=1 Tax=Cervus elaphus hippelaphus TaxID=46360 RepID=A0A212CSI0_CEREH|nr:hypothetical protein Celaphus_00015152 [Cervus elaphus hippelaphus]